MAEGIPMEAITDNVLQKKMASNESHWFSLLLKICQETIQSCKSEEAAKLLGRCAYDSDFVPNRSDDRFQKWNTKGLTDYYTFVHKGAFPSFES